MFDLIVTTTTHRQMRRDLESCGDNDCIDVKRVYLDR